MIFRLLSPLQKVLQGEGKRGEKSTCLPRKEEGGGSPTCSSSFLSRLEGEKKKGEGRLSAVIRKRGGRGWSLFSKRERWEREKKERRSVSRRIFAGGGNYALFSSVRVLRKKEGREARWSRRRVR